MIRWSFHTFNSDLQTGALNGIAFQNYKKRPIRIMTNSRYNVHTEPLLKQLHLLKVKDIFEIQCLTCWYKYVNNKLPNYFRNMFTYNHELHEIETRNHDWLHLYPARTSGARNVLRHHIPELLKNPPPPPLPPKHSHTHTHTFGRQI